MTSPVPTPIRSACETRQDHRPAGIDRGQRRRAVAGGERQAAVGREVGAADRRRVEARALPGEVERRDRRRPRDPVDRLDLALVALVADRDRRDRGEDLVARDDVGQPARRGGPRVGGDRAERHDHREPDDERADRERRPAAIAGDRRAGEPLLEAQDARERQPGDPPERPEQGRASRARRTAAARRRRARARRRVPSPTRGQDEDREHAHDGHDDDQPAHVCAGRRRRVRPRPEGGHGADRRGTTRRLEGGDDRDQHPGDEAEPEHGRGDRRPVELDAARRPQPARRDLREERAEDEPDGRPEDAQQRRLHEDDPTTWPREAPAARSSPSSRIRSTTVIASVLRITNAAANRLIAASSAIVERTSAVEARSEAATSRGDESDVGLGGQRPLERRRSPWPDPRPAASTRSIRVSPSTDSPAAAPAAAGRPHRPPR